MRTGLAVTSLVGVLVAAAAQAPSVGSPTAATGVRRPATEIVGVWRPSEVTDLPRFANLLDGGMPTLGPAGPGLWIITAQHYSLIELNNGGLPRPSEPDSTPTAQELLAMWGPVAANAGTYETRGETLFTRATVSKNPRAMKLPPLRRIFRVVGDTMWLTRPPNSGTIKYIRLE